MRDDLVIDNRLEELDVAATGMYMANLAISGFRQFECDAGAELFKAGKIQFNASGRWRGVHTPMLMIDECGVTSTIDCLADADRTGMNDIGVIIANALHAERALMSREERLELEILGLISDSNVSMVNSSADVFDYASLLADMFSADLSKRIDVGVIGSNVLVEKFRSFLINLFAIRGIVFTSTATKLTIFNNSRIKFINSEVVNVTSRLRGYRFDRVLLLSRNLTIPFNNA